jgi:transcriptional regulator with GAF, ATPase, and Fis domain
MDTAGAACGSSSLVERFQALLTVAESITSCRDPEELFRGLAVHLRPVVPFDALGLVLLHPDRGVTSARVLETSGTGFMTLPERPIAGSHSGLVIETQQPLIVPDTAAETRWPQAMAELKERGIVSFCSLPLTTARRRVGALGFGSRAPVTYTAADVAFLGEVAKLVAVAIDNALAFREIAQLTERLTEERLYLGLEVPLAELRRHRPRADHEDGPGTLETVERRHILRVLGETNWTLGGPRGAAARLGMKRTTLQSLMRRLGITRPRAA